ncbi:hypothetical protein G6F40_016126 [Rhizopus arrhizus]|nr:hypothetical protein G6F40_016126 [Rhizopus arrhizus]
MRPCSPRCSIATTSCSSAWSESCLLSTLVELVAMPRGAGARACRDNHCANPSSGPKLAIACHSADGTLSSALARSPHSQCTPSCAGCGRRLTACTWPCTCSRRGNRNRPIWLVAPETRTVIGTPWAGSGGWLL